MAATFHLLHAGYVRDEGATVRWHTDRTPIVDPLAEDQAALEESRQRILAVADVVVPGHGQPFATGRAR
jgi:glyoxylase-like metal-dependent hydrolase (beta-lactamase superfamily II)